jgi:hypothetical protein
MIIQKVAGNSYIFDDGTVRADIEILGSEEGFLVQLKGVAAAEGSATLSIAVAAERIGGYLLSAKKARGVTVMHDGKFIFTDRPRQR